MDAKFPFDLFSVRSLEIRIGYFVCWKIVANIGVHANEWRRKRERETTTHSMNFGVYMRAGFVVYFTMWSQIRAVIEKMKSNNLWNIFLFFAMQNTQNPHRRSLIVSTNLLHCPWMWCDTAHRLMQECSRNEKLTCVCLGPQENIDIRENFRITF